jgi:Chaperone of endosialidase
MTSHTLHSKANLISGVIAALIAGSASAQQPPDVVPSDAGGNSAMGADALLLLKAPNCSTNTACENIAAGVGALYANSTGSYNEAYGFQSLNNNLTGTYNAAYGYRALHKNTTGGSNTAVGTQALYSNQTGISNTATGSGALYSNLSSYNTAAGFNALHNNATGTQNSAFGLGALSQGAAGSYNTAVGSEALLWNNGGNYNTAMGMQALSANVTGTDNTASGNQALLSNTTGDANVAFGSNALQSNVSGGANVALGQSALLHNTTGYSDIAIGELAGSDTTGSNNIDIGSEGAAGENGVVRIGTPGTHTAVFISGIESTKITGNAVYVTSKGELGVLASAERYKFKIEPMGVNTEKLQQLRPVTFHLKTDPNGMVQYGLIAEEVNKVYPELVIRDESGAVQGVRYDELAPMLLNEVQQQKSQLHDMQQQVAELKKLNDSVQLAMAKLLEKEERLAMR